MSNKKALLFISTLVVLCSINFSANTLPVETEVKNQNVSEVAYEDVTESDWFCGDVGYVTEKGLMKGTGGNYFSPNQITTRGMVVTIMWRLENQPIIDEAVFADVGKDTYYYNAVAWAYKNGIVTGYDYANFGPNDAVTREQMATLFFRYAKFKGYDTTQRSDLDSFADLSSAGAYSIESFSWANANSIILGVTKETLSPKGNTLRSQTAAILKRFSECYSIYEDVALNPDMPEIIKPENPQSEPEQNIHNSSESGLSDKNDNIEIKHDNDVNIDGKPAIFSENVIGTSGKSVTVPIKIRNNPGILGMTLTLEYDETVLSLESVKSGEAVDNILDFTSSKQLESGCRFVWDGIEIAPDQVKDGTILYLNYSINAQAGEGEYKYTISYDEGDIVDNSLSVVSPIIENGCVVVKIGN